MKGWAALSYKIVSLHFGIQNLFSDLIYIYFPLKTKWNFLRLKQFSSSPTFAALEGWGTVARNFPAEGVIEQTFSAIAAGERLDGAQEFGQEPC